MRRAGGPLPGLAHCLPQGFNEGSRSWAGTTDGQDWNFVEVDVIILNFTRGDGKVNGGIKRAS